MNLLFITSTRIGDAVLSTGLLDHLIRAERAAGRGVPRVTVAVGAPAAALFAAVPGIERVIPIVKRRHAGHWRDLWRAVIGTHWDMVVDLRGSAIAWILRARRRRVLSRHEDGRHKLFQLARTLDLDPPRHPASGPGRRTTTSPPEPCRPMAASFWWWPLPPTGWASNGRPIGSQP
ncbi:hypothetical protein ACFQ4K_24160 [Tistrella bauzanensis]